MAFLSREEVEVIARRHFGDLGEEAVGIATAIARAESGWNTEAVGDNFASGYQGENSPYRWDRGLMQINSIWAYDPVAIMDPDTNMAAARYIYNRQGWGAWSTWKFGQAQPFYQLPTPVPAPEPVPAPPDDGLDKYPFATLAGSEREDFLRGIYQRAYGYNVATQIRVLPTGPNGERRFLVTLPAR